MTFEEWQARNPKAAQELQAVTTLPDATVVTGGKSEEWAQQRVRMQFAKLGGLLWRNNVGATPTHLDVNCPKCGFKSRHPQRPIRYGLANDSMKLNETVKSSDLIGVMPVQIRRADVGRTIGQFCAIEMKRPGWTYTGAGREQAQSSFLQLVTSRGGLGQFSTGEFTL